MPKLDLSQPVLADLERLLLSDSKSLPDLPNKKGKTNWVEKSGGLPSYIKRIAKHLHHEEGMEVGRAIATAVNTVKKWARGGDNVKEKTKALAIKAVGQWEAKKGKSVNASVPQMTPMLPCCGTYAESGDRDLILAMTSWHTAEEPVDPLKMDLDQEAFAAALKQARIDMAVQFDPIEHPRDWRGRFRKTLEAVKADVEQSLKREPHAYRTDIEDDHGSEIAEEALADALKRHDPDNELTGIDRYNDEITFPDGSQMAVGEPRLSEGDEAQLEAVLDDIEAEEGLLDDDGVPEPEAPVPSISDPKGQDVVDRLNDVIPANWTASSEDGHNVTVLATDEYSYEIVDIGGNVGGVWRVAELRPGESRLPASEIPGDRVHELPSVDDLVDFFERQVGSH